MVKIDKKPLLAIKYHSMHLLVTIIVNVNIKRIKMRYAYSPFSFQLVSYSTTISYESFCTWTDFQIYSEISSIALAKRY